ncbi:MAG: hypothetical protein QOD71_62, partial [Thermoleophilaceae bacterium]|nr:hypothetical protein [Thermoleophilaceae bacterium]
NDYSGSTHGLAFGKDGRLYLSLTTQNKVVEINPLDGAEMRDVAAVTTPIAIATDPLTGDLFVSSVNSTQFLTRIADPAGAAPTASNYAGGFSDLDGITVAQDGTLYVADRGANPNIIKVAGTADCTTPPCLKTPLVEVPNADGIGLAANPDPSVQPFIIVNRTDGQITKVDLSVDPPALSTVLTNGSRGDFVTVGLDGCLYATQTDRVLKITLADNTCDLAPSSPVLPVTVGVTPAGAGTVVSEPAGIDCGAMCTANFTNGGSVMLTATSADGFKFDGWSEDCANQGAACTLTVSAPRSATAHFLEAVAPQTTAAVTPAPNAAGWNRGDVKVDLNATDGPTPGASGIQFVDATREGAESGTNQAEDDDHLSVPVVAEGVTTLSYRSTDWVDNVESPHSLTVKIDRTAPTVSFAGLPADAKPQVGDTLLAAFSCGDPGAAASGVATCAGSTGAGRPLDTSSAGARTLTVDATDVAGNAKKATYGYTVIEKPAPPPAPTPTPAPAATPTPAPAAPAFGEVAVLPSVKRCVSRRSFRIRLRTIKGGFVVKATVFVNKKRVKVVRGSRLTAPVNLRGLPRGAFSVKIVLSAADGRSVSGTRRYHTCVSKRKSRRPPPV